MTIIDRYVLRQFIKTFLICFLSLTGLYVVFDAFTNLENFSNSAGEQANLAALLASYYAYRSLFFFDLTAPMLTLTAAMFTVTWLRRHNEMTALLAAGVSRMRVVKPIIVAAIVMTLLATINREIVMPQCRYELCRSPYDLVGKSERELKSRYDAKTDILIDGASSCAALRKIVRPVFYFPTTLNDYGPQLEAKAAYYLRAEGDRPGGYLLQGITEPSDFASRPSLVWQGEPILLTPTDSPVWLQNDPRVEVLRKKIARFEGKDETTSTDSGKSSPGLRKDECFVVSDVVFEMLTEGLTYASTAELISGMNNPSLDFGPDVRVNIHSRIVSPFANVTLLFLGLPMVLRRENRNVFLAIGICMVVVTGFSAVSMTANYLGTSYLISSSLAAWLPLILFIPLAVYLSYSMFD